MADLQALQEDAVKFANRAVDCDKRDLVDNAVFYYQEAANALLSASLYQNNKPEFIEKAQEYLNRSEQLKNSKHTVTSFREPVKTEMQKNLERIKCILNEAFEVDEQGKDDDALELYLEAAELCIKIAKETADENLKKKLNNQANNALSRAETLKKTQSSSNTQANMTNNQRPLGILLNDSESSSGSTRSKNAGLKSTGGSYTKEEKEVLKTTSTINGREYVPFMISDLKEKFAFPMPFTDKWGHLQMSEKQKKRFSRWVRPDEYCSEPKMIYIVSPMSIRQTIISDCSFVASLAISAQYERRFNKKLITSIIYPQNRQGEPVYNPCGKYMIKLNINGVPRKVTIDDLLPISSGGELLCSYSCNRGELWVSLLEKAYLKVMGGYDFPGSNSNIDLHALTGWIPERLSIDQDFNAEKEYKRICDRFHKGDCLVTVATGKIPEVEADRAGLVPTHAYALLDIREVKGHKLIQLKNPWSHLRWKGNFSELDIQHWTPDMQKLCNYNPESARNHDNGVFWIDYDSLRKFFSVIYINWNPALFKHTTCVHHTWRAKEGPRKDSYNVGDNPQYKLQINQSGSCALWIHLLRHITDKDDFAENKEFITVVVFKGNGKRIFYPYNPPPYVDGVRINSPHYLCKMLEEGPATYTLVISQYEKSVTTHYTLRVYSNLPFALSKINDPYNPRYEKEINDKWEGKTAGGCSNFSDTFQNNPIYQIHLDNKSANNMMLFELKAPKQYSINVDVTNVNETVGGAIGSFKRKDSGIYRSGFCVLELENISGGVYNVMVSTFKPKQEGPYILTIKSSESFKVSRLK